MRKQDALKVKVGDYIHLKHNRGQGRVVDAAIKPRPGFAGRYPMFQFEDSVTGNENWCTYLVVDVHTTITEKERQHE